MLGLARPWQLLAVRQRQAGPRPASGRLLGRTLRTMRHSSVLPTVTAALIAPMPQTNARALCSVSNGGRSSEEVVRTTWQLLGRAQQQTLSGHTRQTSGRSPLAVWTMRQCMFRVDGVCDRRLDSVVAGGFRRYASSLTQRRLGMLETKANANVHDPSLQHEYLQELLLRGMPHLLVQRFEHGGFEINDDCREVYVRALQTLGQLEKAQQYAKTFARDDVFDLNSPYDSQAPRLGSLPRGTAKSNPVYVVVEETRKTQMYKWIKFGLLFTLATYLVLIVATVLVETSGILRSFPSHTEFNAESSQSDVRFSDVQGIDEAKEELEEVVEFLRDPARFSALGGKLPKGILLTGPPGTGKTMLARAVAGEAGVPFLHMSGSEFDEMYVGVGAKRVRELFAAARTKAPSIVFIDELDAIGSKRNPKDQSYIKQTLNQLLVELDGFSQSSGVVIIAATNYPELLDKALTRPGRFDRHVNVPLPDVRGRVQILQHHMKSIEFAPDVNVSILARGTPGFSGADLANLINLAAIKGSKESARAVDMKHFEYAKDKILMGTERRSHVMTKESKEMTAYHEGGHAILALYTPGAIPLYKCTVLPRGQSLGITFQLPEMDKDSTSMREYQAMIDVALGGRAAEELIYGKELITSGSHSDIQKATEVARAMVCDYGMSEKVGPVYHDSDIASSSMKQLVESEIKHFIDSACTRAMNVLRSHKKELDLLARALVEYETLTAEEIERAIHGERIDDSGTSSILSQPFSPSAASQAAKQGLRGSVVV